MKKIFTVLCMLAILAPAALKADTSPQQSQNYSLVIILKYIFSSNTLQLSGIDMANGEPSNTDDNPEDAYTLNVLSDKGEILQSKKFNVQKPSMAAPRDWFDPVTGKQIKDKMPDGYTDAASSAQVELPITLLVPYSTEAKAAEVVGPDGNKMLTFNLPPSSELLKIAQEKAAQQELIMNPNSDLLTPPPTETPLWVTIIGLISTLALLVIIASTILIIKRRKA